MRCLPRVRSKIKGKTRGAGEEIYERGLLGLICKFRCLLQSVTTNINATPRPLG